MKNFLKYNHVSWRIVCSAAKANSQMALFYEKLQISAKEKRLDQDQVSEFKDMSKRLIEIDKILLNWEMQITWFEPFEASELADVVNSRDFDVSCKLAYAFYEKAVAYEKWLRTEADRKGENYKVISKVSDVKTFSSSSTISRAVKIKQ